MAYSPYAGDDDKILWAFAAAIPLGILLLGYGDWKLKKRYKALTAALATLGLTFKPLKKAGAERKPPELPSPLWDFKVMKQSSDDEIHWVASGSYRGVPTWVYEYSYISESSPDPVEWIAACFQSDTTAGLASPETHPDLNVEAKNGLVLVWTVRPVSPDSVTALIQRMYSISRK